MKHKRKPYRPIPFWDAAIGAAFIQNHLDGAFEEFMDRYFLDTPKSLRNRLLPSSVEWSIINDRETPFFYIKFICDIDADVENSTLTGTLSLTTEVAGGLDAGHYRSIQVEDENQEFFDCLYYKDIQTAVEVCELLKDGKEEEARDIALAQPDYPAEWAYQVEAEMRKGNKER